MSYEPAPVVAQWDLMLRIKRRRAELGITAAQITKHVGLSKTYWSGLENFKGVLVESKLLKLVELLDISEAETKEWLELRAIAKEQNWLSKYSAILRENIVRFYGLESGAECERVYESILVPGLLQTEEYAHALLNSNLTVTVKQVDVKKLVEVRMRRQERIFDPLNPLRLNVIMNQAALMQETGGPGVLKNQLRRLCEVIENRPDTVEVRVIPFDSPTGNVVGGATFFLLDFASGVLPSMAWYECAGLGYLEDEESPVEGLGFTHSRAASIALSREESLSLIKKTEQRLR